MGTSRYQIQKRNFSGQLIHLEMPVDEIGFSGLLINQPTLSSLTLFSSASLHRSQVEIFSISHALKDNSLSLHKLNVQLQSLRLADILDLIVSGHSFINQVRDRVNFWCEKLQLSDQQDLLLRNFGCFGYHDWHIRLDAGDLKPLSQYRGGFGLITDSFSMTMSQTKIIPDNKDFQCYRVIIQNRNRSNPIISLTIMGPLKKQDP